MFPEFARSAVAGDDKWESPAREETPEMSFRAAEGVEGTKCRSLDVGRGIDVMFQMVLGFSTLHGRLERRFGAFLVLHTEDRSIMLVTKLSVYLG